ncbi:hypothetical protein BAY61_31975 (plasmid) [Prauserella marina]|nr:hypothetical protein [Prauserella marina]ASR39903.1 hypothetical protein BAY61_31975 [Prauserella marina]
MSTDHSDTDTVTVNLGPWVADVDRYATREGLSREAAVLALIRDALTTPRTNTVTGSVGGNVVQGRDIQGGLSL